MTGETVILRHARAGQPARVMLREPSGRDELALDGVDTRNAIALLARVVADPVDVAALAAGDRDALLAALHRQRWGDRIVATLTCGGCEARFDLAFELSAVQRHLARVESGWRRDAGGAVIDDDGHRFTPPTGTDEIAAVADGPRGASARLAQMCGVGPNDDASLALAAAAFDAIAPIVDLELAASCAECGLEQLAHFDLQGYVLQRLLQERPALLVDVHLLATSHGWSLREILGLRRSERRAFAEMIAKPRARTRGAPR
jgi:hypothetical protein